MIRVFVYGTLLPGETNFDVGKPYLIGHTPGQVWGTLYDAGPYPGIVPGGPRLVRGCWYDLHDSALPALDELEGYLGPGRANDYERVWVADARDPEYTGWIYVWRDSRGFPEIAGGSWSARANGTARKEHK